MHPEDIFRLRRRPKRCRTENAITARDFGRSEGAEEDVRVHASRGYFSSAKAPEAM
jgi:hypothetical protein